MPKQVTMYRDDKTGRFVKGKKQYVNSFSIRDVVIDEQKEAYENHKKDQQDVISTAIKEYLRENADIVDDEPEPTPTGFDIINFLMDISVKAFACLLFFVAAMYLGVRV